MSVVPGARDLVAYAQSLLPGVVRGKPNWTKLVRVLVKPFQAVYDALLQLLLLRSIETAVGKQLDTVGALIGRRRAGADDDVYRVRLKAQLLLLRSNGTVEQIIGVFDAVEEGEYVLRPRFPAGFRIDAIDPLSDDVAVELGAMMRQGKAGGVYGVLVASPAARGTRFRFSPTSAPNPSSGTGFGDGSTPGLGGVLKGVY